MMAMTDHELLRLAAIAAGLEFGVIHGTPRIKCEAGWTPWNPLEDDGDAFRLMVKLCLNPRPSALDGTAECSSQYEIHHFGEVQSVLQATRLVIVRAAAEIANEMRLFNI